MGPNKIAKQMLSFQRILFDNTFNAATVIHDHSENMMNACFEQCTWVNDEAKKPFNDSVAFVKSARENCRKIVEQGYDKLEELIINK